MQRLVCQKCQEPLRSENVNLELGLAQCHACQSAWELKARPYLDRPPALKPDRWTERRDGGLRLSLKWMGPEAIGALLFCVVWNGFIAFAFLAALADDPVNALFMLVLPHTWIGVGFLWYVAALLLNETEIRVGEGLLKVRHGPVPWPGSVEMKIDEIDQFYVELSSVRVNKRSRWNLVAIGRDQVARPIVKLLRHTDEARWLEQALEAEMKIVDRPVSGEAAR